MPLLRDLSASILTVTSQASLRSSTINSLPRRMFSSYIVTPKELKHALDGNPPSNTLPHTVPVSAEWFLPNDERKGYQEYLKKRIPTARFFELDGIKDPDSPYPHMVPSGEVFAEAMARLGIRREDTVVVYDSPALGLFSAPRAAWTFKVFGHPKVHILNNFKQWIDEGYPTSSGDANLDFPRTSYPAVEPDQDMISHFEEIRTLARSEDNGKKIQIIDARPHGRWTGADPEPRPGLSSGHIPNSISIPFSKLVDPESKGLRSAEELRKIILESGVNPSEDVEKRLMCGSGVTAVVIDLAMSEAGIAGKRKVYDGSWSEWAERAAGEDDLIVKS